MLVSLHVECFASAAAEDEENEDIESPAVSPRPSANGSSFLQTRSSNARGVCKGALYKRRVLSAKRSEARSATDTMTESSLLEALTAKVHIALWLPSVAIAMHAALGNCCTSAAFR